MQDILSFSGRRKRLSFFMTWLAIVACNLVAQLVAGMVVGGVMGASGPVSPAAAEGAGAAVGFLVAIPFLWPQFAVGAQRLHDMGYSGWFQVLLFIPLINLILLLVMLFARSEPRDNRFGPSINAGYVRAVTTA